MASRFAAVVLAASIVASNGLANACDFCGLPIAAQHRAGSFAVYVKTDRSTYSSGSDPLVTVTLTNNGTIPLYVDDATPVWKQTSLHIAGPQSGLSFPDAPPGQRRRLRIAPGSSFTFASPNGARGTALSRWNAAFKMRGIYRLDVTYDHVDGPTASFTIM